MFVIFIALIKFLTPKYLCIIAWKLICDHWVYAIFIRQSSGRKIIYIYIYINFHAIKYMQKLIYSLLLLYYIIALSQILSTLQIIPHFVSHKPTTTNIVIIYIYIYIYMYIYIYIYTYIYILALFRVFSTLLRFCLGNSANVFSFDLTYVLLDYFQVARVFFVFSCFTGIFF